MCALKHSPLTVLFIVVALSQELYGSNDLANGLGKNYEWHTLEDGLKLAKETGKPLMLIIHKSWCGACKSFKPKFASSGSAVELSQNFVMVNTMDNDEPADEKYKPDGGYIPRILFLDSSGTVHEEIFNENGNPKYKFYYYEETAVIRSMAKALHVLIPAGSRGDEL